MDRADEVGEGFFGPIDPDGIGARGPHWIDDLLESGHRCPACGSRDFEVMSLNQAGQVGFGPEDEDDPDSPLDWRNTLEEEELLGFVSCGTIKVHCHRCRFVLWDIVAAVQKAVAFIRSETPLKPADAEGRTFWKEEAPP